jgi:myo-inositol 2-dehydrogenase / D-chiro-inositol 1-dehydrogenase
MKTRLGMIGVGGIGRFHAEHLVTHPEAELTAVCDIDEARLDDAARRYGSRPFKDYREMIGAVELDAVYVCVPPYVDGPMEIDCLDAGLHILVEKPVALDMATARRVEAKAVATGRITAVGYHWRYMGATDLAREMLGSEPIAFLQGQWVGGMPTVFWWRQMAMGGGQFTEQCTHIIDLARYFGGEVTQVMAGGTKGLMSQRVPNHDIWDAQAAVLTFASGLVAPIHTAHLGEWVTSVGLKIYTPDSCFEIGEMPWNSNLTVRRKGEVTHFNGVERGWREPRYVEDDAFIEAVRTGDPSHVRCDYSEGVKTLAVNLATTRACESGQVVAVKDVG